jgi:hypothetical protein
MGHANKSAANVLGRERKGEKREARPVLCVILGARARARVDRLNCPVINRTARR